VQAPLEKLLPPLEKCVGHSLKTLDIVQKIWTPFGKLFAPPGVSSWLRAWGSQIGGRQEGLHLLKIPVCLRQALGVTQKWLPFLGQKVAIPVGQTMRFFRENHSLKALHIINSEKV